MRRRIVNRPRRAVAIVILTIFSAAMARTIIQAVRVVGKTHADAMAADERRYQEGICYHRDARGRLEVWGGVNPPHWGEPGDDDQWRLVQKPNPLYDGLWASMNYNSVQEKITYGVNVYETSYTTPTEKNTLTQKTGKL